MGLTRREQETVIRWDEEEKIVHVWAASPVTWRKMARLGLTPNSIEGKTSGKVYVLPLSLFRWGVRAKRGRPGNPEALARFRQASDKARRDHAAPGGPA